MRFDARVCSATTTATATATATTKKQRRNNHSLTLHADRAYLLLHIGAADGALLELGSARQAAAVVPARYERAVHLPFEAHLWYCMCAVSCRAVQQQQQQQQFRGKRKRGQDMRASRTKGVEQGRTKGGPRHGVLARKGLVSGRNTKGTKTRPPRHAPAFVSGKHKRDPRHDTRPVFKGEQKGSGHESQPGRRRGAKRTASRVWGCGENRGVEGGKQVIFSRQIVGV